MDVTEDAGLTITDRRGEYAATVDQWKIHEFRSAEWAFVGANKTPSGVRVTPETALKCSAFIACVRVISETLASCPLNLVEEMAGGGKRYATEQPLYRTLSRRPNSWQTRFEFVETMTALCCMYGTSFALRVPGRNGAYDQLVPLHPSRVTVKQNDDYSLTYLYRQPVTEQQVPYRQEDIFRLSYLSTDGFTGLQPPSMLRDAIGLAQALEQHAGAFFGNGARPGVVFTNDNAMPQEAIERAREQWERMHRGADRAFRTAFLPQGTKPVELATASNEQAQFLESRQYQIIDIARYFRVPPHLLQDLTRATYSNIEQNGIDALTYCIQPWAQRWAGAIGRDLVSLTLPDTFCAEFDLRRLSMGDSASRTTYYREMLNIGAISIDEIRAMEGLNPVENGGEARFMQLNMTTVDRIINPPAAAPADEFAPVPTQPAAEDEDSSVDSSADLSEVDESEQAEMIQEDN
jgi:HK97 family phage portal protein